MAEEMSRRPPVVIILAVFLACASVLFIFSFVMQPGSGTEGRMLFQSTRIEEHLHNRSATKHPLNSFRRNYSAPWHVYREQEHEESFRRNYWAPSHVYREQEHEERGHRKRWSLSEVSSAMRRKDQPRRYGNFLHAHFGPKHLSGGLGEYPPFMYCHGREKKSRPLAVILAAEP